MNAQNKYFLLLIKFKVVLFEKSGNLVEFLCNIWQVEKAFQ